MSKSFLQLQAPVAKVLSTLGKVSRRQRGAENAGWRWALYATLGLLAGSVVLGVFGPPGFITGLALFLGSSALMCLPILGIINFLFARERRSKDPDVECKRPKLVSLLLMRLQRDIAPGMPVTLQLRPKPPPNGPGSGYFPWKYVSETAKEWSDPWLTLETRLADGTYLRVRMVEWRHGRLRKRPEGNTQPSKLKFRDSLEVEIQLRTKARKHPGLATLTKAQALKAVRLPYGATRPRLKHAEDRIRLRVRVNDGWRAQRPPEMPANMLVPDASHILTMMLLSLYQVLNGTRPAPKVKQKKAGRRAPL